MTKRVSVLIPAHNEAAHIRACLAAVFSSAPLPAGWCGEVLVIANGCADDTAARARTTDTSEDWALRVLDLPEGGKLAALNAGDAVAIGDVLIYLDADVRVSTDLIPQVIAALTQNGAKYASGSPRIPPARSAITRAYARFWMQLPFFRSGVPGFGVFAMTRKGRTRWGEWPDIIADDIFARLRFAPTERQRVAATYSWPMVEGFRNLIRVRRRQNAGVAEIDAKYPQLIANEDKAPISTVTLLRHLLADPFGFLIYVSVTLAVKTPIFASGNRWTRGR